MAEEDRQRLVEAAAHVLSREPDVVAAYLYGSAARGEPAHDLDVAVSFEGRVDPRRLEPLAARLQAEAAPHGPEIDLRPLNDAAPRFQVAVLRDGVLLFERDRRRRLEQEARAMSRWADFRPRWELMRRRMRARWARG
jgi:predicted nucleotidyltransferase